MPDDALPEDGPAGLDPRDVAALERLQSGAAQVLPDGGLAAKLGEARRQDRPLRVKFGIDPSGTDLTLGHAVPLRKLRQFQDAGHLAVIIIGDFTGQVGDPSGKTSTRAAKTAAETDANASTYFDQVLRILDPDRLEVRRNSEWLATMSMTDVIREARELTVARLLERDDFAQRFASHQPISLVEFLYPLLQGYDSVAVHADVELGGTDQTYNLLVGRDLQRAHGQSAQVVLTVPLLEGLDGVEKMGKSLGNFVAIGEAPAEQFGKLMSLPDPMIGRYLRLCTDLHPAEIDELEAVASAGGPATGAAKRRMAREIVGLYHGAGAAEAAEAHFNAVVRDREASADVPEAPLPAGDPIHLPAALRAAGLAGSTSEARRLIDDGAVRLGGVTVTGGYDVARNVIAGQVVQCGKRRQVRFVG